MGSNADSLGRGAKGATPEEAFTPLTGAPLAHFEHCVNPPAAMYLTLQDRIFVTAINFLPNIGVVATLSGRLLRMDGVVIPLNYIFSTPNGTGQSFLFDAAEGWLLDLSIRASFGSAQSGSTFIQAGIARGTVSNFERSAVLISQQLEGTRIIAWPYSRMDRATDGQGLLKATLVGNPAPGADFIYTVPTGVRQRVLSVFFTLTTSAAAATRSVTLIIDDGANILGQFPASITQIASLTNVYTGSAAPYAPVTLATVGMVPLPPDLRLFQAHRLRSNTASIQAADQFSTIALLVESWLDTA